MRKGWKRGYKIVRFREVDSRLISMTGYNDHIDRRDAVYIPGVDTVPPENCGPLAVFTDRAKAIAYARRQGNEHLDVWKCVYLPTDRTDAEGRVLWAPVSDEPGSPIYGMRRDDLPDGTAYADAVRLISQIEGETR